MPGYTLAFCITKPVDKKVLKKNIICTALAPTPIQSSSYNIHYKNEALNLKPLCSIMISEERESVIIHMGVKRGLRTKTTMLKGLASLIHNMLLFSGKVLNIYLRNMVFSCNSTWVVQKQDLHSKKSIT